MKLYWSRCCGQMGASGQTGRGKEARKNHAGNDHCSHCNSTGRRRHCRRAALRCGELSHSSPGVPPGQRRKKVEDAKGYTAMYGTFREGDEAFDEGVALFFRAPHSYTGEDVVELSCHGGSAVARRLVEACLAAGAQPAAPGEYTRRAFLNGKLGLTQAEAVMDLISADGRQGAALANAALGGALAKKISAQKEALTAIQAHLAAWVDFPEEDVPELDGDHLHRVLSGVKAELDELIHNYQADTVLREGVDCAIVGRPNAGKSTLLNLLAGFDRAIVTPVAGTTRDVVEQAVQLGDIQLNLFDTAGLRETEDAIEAEGIRRSWKNWRRQA